MNPYTPPSTTSGINEVTSAIAIEDHSHYSLVLKMVLWGEDREEIYRRMEVNGINGKMADRLYKHALADRIKTIRHEYTRKFWIGVLFVFSSLLIFSLCWFRLGIYSKNTPVYLLCRSWLRSLEGY